MSEQLFPNNPTRFSHLKDSMPHLTCVWICVCVCACVCVCVCVCVCEHSLGECQWRGRAPPHWDEDPARSPAAQDQHWRSEDERWRPESLENRNVQLFIWSSKQTSSQEAASDVFYSANIPLTASGALHTKIWLTKQIKEPMKQTMHHVFMKNR